MQAGPPNDLPLSLYVWAAGLLQVIVGGLAVAIWRDVRSHGRELLALRITLTGENGDNGIKSQVAGLHKSKHRIDGNAHTLAGAIEATRVEAGLSMMGIRLRAEGEQ